MTASAREAVFNQKFTKYKDFTVLEKFVRKFEVHRSDVIKKLMPHRGRVLLDLACGNGDFLFSQKARFKKLIGLDISSHRITETKKLFKANKNQLQTVIRDLDRGIPLGNSTVDVVVCEASLAYFMNPEFVIQEVHRVLKTNGIFIIQIGNYAFILRRLALLFGNLPKISSFKGFGDGGMIHYFTYQSLKDLLAENGFSVTHSECSGVLTQVRKILPSLLASDIIYKAVKVSSRKNEK